MRRAEVLGCVRPGVPVWRLGPDSRAPGLAYVVFPGNVGAVDDLAKATAIMAGKSSFSVICYTFSKQITFYNKMPQTSAVIKYIGVD